MKKIRMITNIEQTKYLVKAALTQTGTINGSAVIRYVERKRRGARNGSAYSLQWFAGAREGTDQEILRLWRFAELDELFR